MTNFRVSKSLLQWLLTLALAVWLPASYATTAVVFSESTGRYGVAFNEPSRDAALKKAVEDCRHRGGAGDCKPVKVTDETGFGTVAMTCAGTYCGLSVISGRPTAAQAERDAVEDCNSYYGTKDCRAYDRWQEKKKAVVENEVVNQNPRYLQYLLSELKISKTETKKSIDFICSATRDGNKISSDTWDTVTENLKRENLGIRVTVLQYLSNCGSAVTRAISVSEKRGDLDVNARSMQLKFLEQGDEAKWCMPNPCR
jgi:hypothetical protein